MIPNLQGGGAQRVASIIGNYYVDKGEQVYYFLAKNSGRFVYQVKGKVISIEIPVGAKNIVSLLQGAYILRKYKKKYQIDVAISFMEEFNYLNVLSKRQEVVITRICTILSKRDDLKGQFLYQDRNIRFFYKHADKVVVMTKYAQREMIEKYGIQKSKIVRIPNPVNEQIIGAVQEIPWEYGEKEVVCVGRLESVKQHNIAIRAFSDVVKDIPDARLLLLGVGPEQQKMKKLISELRLEKSVKLLGFRKDIFYYLRNAKVFLMTSKTEGFPNSMVEAMSAGLPIVSINSPGAAAEILGAMPQKKQGEAATHGKYGIITPYIQHEYFWKQELTREEKILSKTLIRVLTDETVRKYYSERAKKRAATYQLDKVMKKWNQLITGGKRK